MIELSKLKKQLIQHEGLKLRPYRCTAGKLTIGVGRNLDDVGITEFEAGIMLENDIYRTLSEVKKLPFFDKIRASEPRIRAVVDMVFNLGMPRFLGFKKMIQAMESADFETASKEMLDSKWASQVGRRAQKLAEMIKNGED